MIPFSAMLDASNSASVRIYIFAYQRDSLEEFSHFFGYYAPKLSQRQICKIQTNHYATKTLFYHYADDTIYDGALQLNL